MTFPYNIILASNSPRRKELLSGLDFDYEIVVIPNVDESYPEELDKTAVAQYIAEKKADAYTNYLTNSRNMVITADTVVLLDNVIYGKPKNEDDASRVLHALSGNTHQVITGVCIRTSDQRKAFSVTTEVRFGYLSDSEIDYYVQKYKPLDKAGAYGIQEWIGFVAVEHISGSYFNVMGLPIQRLYKELMNF